MSPKEVISMQHRGNHDCVFFLTLLLVFGLQPLSSRLLSQRITASLCLLKLKTWA